MLFQRFLGCWTTAGSRDKLFKEHSCIRILHWGELNGHSSTGDSPRGTSRDCPKAQWRNHPEHLTGDSSEGVTAHLALGETARACTSEVFLIAAHNLFISRLHDKLHLASSGVLAHPGFLTEWAKRGVWHSNLCPCSTATLEMSGCDFRQCEAAGKLKKKKSRWEKRKGTGISTSTPSIWFYTNFCHNYLKRWQ